jgi:hypothetical protein
MCKEQQNCQNPEIIDVVMLLRSSNYSAFRTRMFFVLGNVSSISNKDKK